MDSAAEMIDLSDTFDVAALAQPRSSAASRANDFYELTKPRLNFLVLVTTAVGYYMAAHQWSDWPRLLHVLFGTAMTAAGASVLNQVIERDYDRLMNRTRNRPLPAGRISPPEAVLCGIAFCAIAGYWLGTTFSGMRG